VTFRSKEDEALRRLEMKVSRLDKEIKGGIDPRFFYMNMAGFGLLAFVSGLLAYQALGSRFLILPALLAVGGVGIVALNVFLLFKAWKKPEKVIKKEQK